jgi:hypothetical protein
VPAAGMLQDAGLQRLPASAPPAWTAASDGRVLQRNSGAVCPVGPHGASTSAGSAALIGLRGCRSTGWLYACAATLRAPAGAGSAETSPCPVTVILRHLGAAQWPHHVGRVADADQTWTPAGPALLEHSNGLPDSPVAVWCSLRAGQ